MTLQPNLIDHPSLSCRNRPWRRNPRTRVDSCSRTIGRRLSWKSRRKERIIDGCMHHILLSTYLVAELVSSKLLCLLSWAWYWKLFFLKGATNEFVMNPYSSRFAFALTFTDSFSCWTSNLVASKFALFRWGVPLIIGLPVAATDVVAADWEVENTALTVGHTHQHGGFPYIPVNAVTFVIAISALCIFQPWAVDDALLLRGAPHKTNRTGAAGLGCLLDGISHLRTLETEASNYQGEHYLHFPNKHSEEVIR